MGTVPLLILLLLLTVPFLAAADAFCDNVKSIAPTLPQKTTSSPLHFATATIGQTPDTVYALALCRGDILDDYTCAECVASTFDKMIRRRPSPQRECYKAAYYYYDNCTLIYSSKDILAGSPNNTGIDGNVAPTFERWNTKL